MSSTSVLFLATVAAALRPDPQCSVDCEGAHRAVERAADDASFSHEQRCVDIFNRLSPQDPGFSASDEAVQKSIDACASAPLRPLTSADIRLVFSAIPAANKCEQKAAKKRRQWEIQHHTRSPFKTPKR